MRNTTLSLDGIRVIDLSRVIAGPLCGAMLGDMGADVIKIEDIVGGDESRRWSPQTQGESPAFVANNRNKRSIALDLKHADGKALFMQLVRRADVVLENFRTGTMERLGLGYEVLARENPRLIYCSISAFGRTGPKAQSAGYEALMQAYSGVMSITGEEDGAPVRCGISALDILTGTASAFGIVNAVLMRQKTGRGQCVEGSLLDSAISLLNFQAQGYLLAGVVPKAMGSAHPSLVPYRNFRCRDDQWVFIAAGNDRLWQRLARAVGQPQLGADPRFSDNVSRVAHRDALETLLADCLMQRDRDDWLAHFELEGVPATPVNTVAQALRDPQAATRPVLRRTSHPTLGEIDVVGLPLRFSDAQVLPNRPAPRYSEHAQEILHELGYDSQQIAGFRHEGVLG